MAVNGCAESLADDSEGGMTLGSGLLGAWSLESYMENPVDGSPPGHPFGDDARGRLIYDHGGWMSVRLMVASRPPFASGDWFHAASEELSAAAAFIGYSGTFVVDESAETVSHVIDMSFFPNWIGQTQIRRISLTPNRLELTPVEPIRSGGRDVIPTLRWMRHEQVLSTVGIRSEVRRDGTLHLSLQSTALNDPGPDEVVVEMVAAPLHPADISMLLGPADLASGAITGKGEDRTAVFKIPPERMRPLATRTGKSLPVGNEGAGMVVAAGERHGDLIGKPVAVMGGGMVTRYRVVPARNLLLIPDGVPIGSGAAVLINPLTALAMTETMRERGHSALVHTAAASSLGQMLNRICLQDGIPLVNVVRRPAQVSLLENQGAKYVCDSSSSSFADELNAQVAAAGATLAFDAVGGGKLAGQILSAMEAHCLAQTFEYDRYGSKVHKQVYLYGGLDTRPSDLDRSYGMSWSVGGC